MGNSLLTKKFYHVSTCSDSVLATYVVVFTGALGIIFLLTDKLCERLGPGVVVFNPVNHTIKKKKKITITTHKIDI
jgi:hypothetical protein